MSMMASVRTALLLLPPVSVLLVAAVRCLGRVAARKLSALARAHHQFPAVGVEKGGAAALMPPVALYYDDRSRRRRRSGCGCGGEEQHEHEQAAECVFCLSAIEEGSEVRELKCRHLFHRGCLDRWLLVARPLPTCPLCRCRLLAAARVEDWGPAAESESESDSDDMMLFMACVHGRSSWLWPS